MFRLNTQVPLKLLLYPRQLNKEGEHDEQLSEECLTKRSTRSVVDDAYRLADPPLMRAETQLEVTRWR